MFLELTFPISEDTTQPNLKPRHTHSPADILTSKGSNQRGILPILHHQTYNPIPYSSLSFKNTMSLIPVKGQSQHLLLSQNVRDTFQPIKTGFHHTFLLKLLLLSPHSQSLTKFCSFYVKKCVLKLSITFHFHYHHHSLSQGWGTLFLTRAI